MNPLSLANILLEADDLGFDPEEYVKAGGGEVANVVYEDDVVRIIEPLNVHTLNDYMVGHGKRSENDFNLEFRYERPFYVVIPKTNEGIPAGQGMPLEDPEPIVLYPAKGEMRTRTGQKQLLGHAKNFLGDTAYTAMIDGLAKVFIAQIRKGKGQDKRAALKNLITLGKYEDAAKHGKYHLGKLNDLPVGSSVELAKAIRAQGRRPSGRIQRMMAANNSNILWKDKGFYLLFDDWQDTVETVFDDDNRRFSVHSTAKGALGEGMDWLDTSYVTAKEVFDYTSEENLETIKRKMIGRTYDDPETGDEILITEEIASGLSQGEMEDILFGDSGDNFDEIVDAIRFAGQDAEQSAIEGAYFKAYSEMVESALGKHAWVKAPRYSREQKKYVTGDWLGFFVPYERLDEWLAQEKEEEGEYYDPGSIDIWSLVNKYVEKERPNEDYYHSFDKEYFNERLSDTLHEVDEIDAVPVEAEPVDPNQLEIPLDDERVGERPVKPLGMVRVVIYNGDARGDKTKLQAIREIQLPAADAEEYVAANPNAEILGPVED